MTATERIEEIRRSNPKFKNIGLTKKVNSASDLDRVKKSLNTLEESAKNIDSNNINE